MRRNNIKHQFAIMLMAFIYTLAIAPFTMADDTEIYFGASSSGTIRPNIMFIMDTSGSMASIVPKTNPPQSRLQVLKSALDDILNSVSNVNVGIMRYSAPNNSDNNGGPVLYPIRYIDASATEPQVQAQVNQGSDDAVEDVATQAVRLNDIAITMADGIPIVTPPVTSGGLSNGVKVSVPFLDNGKYKTYHISVPTGASNFNVKLEGGKGYPYLLVNYGSDPIKTQTWQWDCQQYNFNTDRPSLACSYPTPKAGDYYITVYSGWYVNNFTLVASYTGGAVACTTCTPKNQLVGLHFSNVNVPKGAKITSAYLEFVASGNTAANTDVTIQAQKSINSATFTTQTADISLRAKTAAQTSWSSIPAWTSGNTYRSPDISKVVQEVTNLSGWCGGPMTFIISGKGARTFSTYEGSPSLAPKLVVNFDEASAIGGCYQNSVVKQIVATNDDATQAGTNRSSSLNNRDLNFSPNSWIGLRFQSLNIPNNADITSASIEFEGKVSRSSDLTASVYGVRADNPSAFTSTKNGLSNLNKTSSVNWTKNGGWNNDEKFRTHDISSIVKNLASRSGWKSGQSMAFLVKTTVAPRSNFGSAYSYNSSHSRSPVLRVKYKGAYVKGGLTVRDQLINVVNNFTAGGYTPIAGTLAEAALYFRGQGVHYGLVRGTSHSPGFRVSTPLSWTGGTDVLPSGCPSTDSSNPACGNEKITGNPTYISPISETCQANHILFLSDGEPNAHGPITAGIIKGITGSSCSSTDGGRDCSKQLAKFMSTKDQSSTLPGDQIIHTNTISFGSYVGLMDQIAQNGDGIYAQANNRSALLKAFNAVVRKALDTTASFVSAGVTINQSNRLTNADQLYFSLFQPGDGVTWPGNLKKYRLDGSNIVDKNGAIAVLPNGTFNAKATSYWSSVVDGNKVSLGGAAENLTTNRNIYTNVSSSLDLTASANKLSETNSLITQAMLGVTSSADRDLALKWGRGLDVDDINKNGSTTDARKQIGDPLHSRPMLVTYYDKSTGVSSTVVFVGTNQGYLHAINTNLGTEKWAFVPKALLPNLSVYQKNISGGTHPYGLDGNISIYHDDANHDGKIDNGETAILYIGMRRGGRNYYAINISNPTKPKLQFVIRGGTNTLSMGNYTELGQTWSTATPAKIKWKGVAKEVIIFGGGYDTAEDAAGTSPITDTMGRTVFIADALTGKLLWSARDDAAIPTTPTGSTVAPTPAKTTLTASIPSDVKAIDLDNSGYIDTLYVTDIHAQVFRFDISENPVNASGASVPMTVSNFAVGGRIAHLDANTIAGNRRFYYAPDPSLVRQLDGVDFVAVSIGSGYRAHPLNTQTHEDFYVLRDLGVLQSPRVFDKDITMSDLADVSTTVSQTTANATLDTKSGATAAYNAAVAKALAAGASSTEAAKAGSTAATAKRNTLKGWYIDMSVVGKLGEKIMAPSVTINNTVVFSTYTPPASTPGACVPAEGTARTYFVDILNGTPIKSRTAVLSNPTISDRHGANSPGVPPGVIPMFTNKGVVLLDGTKILATPAAPKGDPLEVYRRRQARTPLYP